MAEYLTGRTRRLIVTGRWQSPIQAVWQCTHEWPVSPNRYATVSESWLETIQIRALGMKVEYWPEGGFGSFPADSMCSVTLTGQYKVNQRITMGEGLSFETVDSGDFTADYPVGDDEVFNLDPAADYTFWADVEEWFEVTDPIGDSDSDGFPNYGGDAVKDGLTGRSVRFFERLQPGGEMGVSVTGLVPLELTRRILSADVSEFGEVVHALDRRGSIHVENATSILTISGIFGDLEVEPDYFKSTSTSTFDATDGFELQLTKGLNESGESYGYCYGTPESEFRWRCAIFAGGEKLEEPFSIEIERKAGTTDFIEVKGTADELWTQSSWEAFCVLDGVAQDSESFNNRCPIRHWLTGESLYANGDQSSDWRMQFRGRKWTAFSVEHLREIVLDDGESLEEWTGDAVVLSLADGAVQVAASEGGSVTREIIPAIVSESYRYLEIRARSLVNDDAPVTISIGGKSWIRSTSDAEVWVTWQLDLCQPETTWIEIDDKDSRFPLDEFGEVEDSENWGVSQIEQIDLFNLLVGETYQIDWIKLVRAGDARLSFLPAFREFRLRQVDESDEVKTGGWSEVDGRIADLPGMRRVGTTYSWDSIADFENSISDLGGWVISAGTAPSDGYHSNALESELLWGAAVLGGEGELSNGVDLVCSSETDILSQALWDSVEVYPGAGDVWSPVGELGSQTALYSGKTLRAQTWGLVLRDSGPRVGANAQLIADDELRGEDLTDNRGWFITKLPGGLEGLDHFIKSGSLSSEVFEPTTRWRHRRVFRELNAAGGVSYDWHLAGIAVRAMITSEGISLAFKDNGPDASYRNQQLDFEANSLAIRWDLGREMNLILVTQHDGQIQERTSTDLGETWSMAETLAVGEVKFPALAVHPDGRRFVYWLEDDSVNGVIRDRSGAVLQTVTAARTGVSEVGLSVGTLDQSGGLVSIELITVEDDSVISSLSTDGETFI